MPKRKKLNALFAATLIVLLFVTIMTGCQQKPEITPTSPSPPSPSLAPSPSPSPLSAEFKLVSLIIEPKETPVDETVNITVVVENIGGSEGTYAAILTVDGGSVVAKEVPITAGSSKVITFSLVEDTVGTYEIGIGGLKSTLTVREKSEPVVEKEDQLPPSTLDKAKDESEEPPLLTAAIEITFDRDTVFCKDGEWRWQVILTEINGVGVELNDITMALHGEHDVFWSRSDESWLEAIGGYLPALDSATSRRFVPCQLLTTHVIFTVTGVDDNDNPIVAEGRVNLSQQPRSDKYAAIEISFDPNPAGRDKDNRVIWKTILTEVNGIGVHLTEITTEEYIHDVLHDSSTVDNESKKWNSRFLRDIFPPDAYLPAFGSLDFRGGFPFGSVTRQFTHCICIVVGIDDNGNEVRAEERVDFDFVQ